MKKTALVFMCSLLLAGTATAQEQGTIIGLSYGEAKEDIRGRDYPGASIDRTDNAWKAYVGGRASQLVSVELGYVDFGETTIGSSSARIRTEADAWFASLVLGLPVTSHLTIFGKGGWTRWTQEIRNETPAVGGLFGESGTVQRSTVKDNDPFWGAGVRLKLTPNLSAKLEYEQYIFDNSRNSIRDHRLTTLGLEFLF